MSKRFLLSIAGLFALIGLTCVGLIGFGVIKPGGQLLHFLESGSRLSSNSSINTGIITIDLLKKYDDYNDHNNETSFYINNGFAEGFAMVTKSGKWGFIDRTGKEVIALIYDNTHAFSQGLAAVSINGKWGFIDRTGKEVIPLQYDSVLPFFEGLSIVVKNGRYLAIDKNGIEKIVLPDNYKFRLHFIDGVATIENDGKFGLITKEGQEIVPPQYDDSFSGIFFHNGLAAVRKNGKSGCIDINGRLVIPIRYDNYLSFRLNETDSIIMLNGERFYKDSKGNMKPVPQYDDVGAFDLSALALVRLNGKSGYINRNGEVVIPIKYDGLGSFREGLAGAEVNGKWGFLDKYNNVIIDFQYDDISSFNEGLAVVESGKKLSYIDKTGHVVFELKYEFASAFNDGVAKVGISTVEGTRYGIIDRLGREIALLEYETINDFDEGLAGVKKNGKWGFINLRGQEVIIPQYDDYDQKHIEHYSSNVNYYRDFYTFRDGVTSVRKNGKWGFINYEGREVIPLEYDWVGRFKDGMVLAKKNGRVYYVSSPLAQQINEINSRASKSLFQEIKSKISGFF